MNKIRQYFSTLELTRGFFIALLSSSFIYLNHWGFSIPLINTFLGLLALYLLLESNTKIWFISGTFIGLFWFWWISMSLIHYEMLWAVPIELLIIMFSYGFIFTSIAWLSFKIYSYAEMGKAQSTNILPLIVKAFGLLLLSYIHPFSFDWFKPELLFVESYIGIAKWQFALVLLSIVLTIWRKRFSYLILTIFASQMMADIITPTSINNSHAESIKSTINTLNKIQIVTTHTSVKEKWNERLHPKQFQALFDTIDRAIKEKKKLIILPESVFPVFINRSQKLIDTLQAKAKDISIVTGGLYWDGETPRNSTYIFTNHKISVANKVVLVPFGESNPLPDFLSKWVNKIFYDDAVDYKASNRVTDYIIDGITYRNAICFEATSEKLYEKNREGNYPKNMIVLSNNGWFTPSIEPTLQKLLLLYYHKKYGTTIYHSVNKSESYTIQDGKITKD